jgi:hypothetical protein
MAHTHKPQTYAHAIASQKGDRLTKLASMGLAIRKGAGSHTSPRTVRQSLIADLFLSFSQTTGPVDVCWPIDEARNDRSAHALKCLFQQRLTLGKSCSGAK